MSSKEGGHGVGGQEERGVLTSDTSEGVIGIKFCDVIESCPPSIVDV